MDTHEIYYIYILTSFSRSSESAISNINSDHGDSQVDWSVAIAIRPLWPRASQEGWCLRMSEDFRWWNQRFFRPEKAWWVHKFS